MARRSESGRSTERPLRRVRHLANKDALTEMMRQHTMETTSPKRRRWGQVIGKHELFLRP
jgi:hypothetical protein